MRDFSRLGKMTGILGIRPADEKRLREETRSLGE
jgi:hypothetical protein